MLSKTIVEAAIDLTPVLRPGFRPWRKNGCISLTLNRRKTAPKLSEIMYRSRNRPQGARTGGGIQSRHSAAGIDAAMSGSSTVAPTRAGRNSTVFIPECTICHAEQVQPVIDGGTSCRPGNTAERYRYRDTETTIVTETVSGVFGYQKYRCCKYGIPLFVEI